MSRVSMASSVLVSAWAMRVAVIVLDRPCAAAAHILELVISARDYADSSQHAFDDFDETVVAHSDDNGCALIRKRRSHDLPVNEKITGFTEHGGVRYDDSVVHFLGNEGELRTHPGEKFPVRVFSVHKHAQRSALATQVRCRCLYHSSEREVGERNGFNPH